MTKSIFVSSGLLAAVLLASTPATAKTPHSSELLRVLRAIEFVPTAAQLTSIGVDVEGAALVAAAKDRALPRYSRIRAAGFLGRFAKNPRAFSALRALASGEVEDVDVQIQAIASLSAVRPADAQNTLAALLADERPAIREAAVRGLARSGNRAALIQHRAAEPSDAIRAVIDRKLKRITKTRR